MARPRTPSGTADGTPGQTCPGGGEADGATPSGRRRSGAGVRSVSSAQRVTAQAAQAGRPGGSGSGPRRPAVNSVPPTQRGNPLHDPANPHYDGTPRGEHGNVGTFDPDTPSDTGLTDSGRLHDPHAVPAELQPYVDSGVLVNDNGVLRLADPVDVTFTHSNANHDLAEFNRQVDLQERALNQQSVDDWSSRSDSYDADGRQERAAQQQYREQQIERTAHGYQRDNPGMTEAQARARAVTDMSGQVVLHGPDQVAGGNPLQFTGMGHGGVNSSLGNQWGVQGRAEILNQEMRARLTASGIPPQLWDDIRMNVSLNTRSTVP